jgi:hypothetical protein
MDLAELAKRQIAKNAGERERNRIDFPWTTAILDSLRRDFNDGMPPFNARVIFASENGKTIGRRE